MGERKRIFIIFTMLILWIVLKFTNNDTITITIGLIFLMMVEVFFFELYHHHKLIGDKEKHLLMKLENPMTNYNVNIVIGVIMITLSIFAILKFETRLLYIAIAMILGLFTTLIKKNRVLILSNHFVIIHGNKYDWDEICDVMTEENSNLNKGFNLVISVTERKGLSIKTCSKKIKLTVEEWENHFAMEILSSYYKSRL